MKRSLFKIFVRNLAYHGGVLMTESGKVKLSCCPDLPWLTYRIVQKGDTPTVHDQCYHVADDGTETWLGNRCGCRSHYDELASEALTKNAEAGFEDEDDVEVAA